MVVSAAIRGSALGKIEGKKGDIRVCTDLDEASCAASFCCTLGCCRMLEHKAPLDYEVDPWGCRKLREHLNRTAFVKGRRAKDITVFHIISSMNGLQYPLLP